MEKERKEKGKGGERFGERGLKGEEEEKKAAYSCECVALEHV